MKSLTRLVNVLLIGLISLSVLATIYQTFVTEDFTITFSEE